MKLRKFIYLLGILLTSHMVTAQSLSERITETVSPGTNSQAEKFLRPDEAFIMTVSVAAADQVKVNWLIAEGHYLYQDKFKFEIVEGDAQIANDSISIPRGKVKEDPSFGSVEVLYHGLDVDVPVSRTGTSELPVSMKISYQGCKEDSICYPPIRKTIPLLLPEAGISSSGSNNPPPVGINAAIDTSQAVELSEQDTITQNLINGGLLLNIAAFFGFGLLLSFTPCVFPMIPILSGIIIGQGEKITPVKGFLLSLSYVTAMALTYAVAGIIAAMVNFNLQAASQNIWVISSFSIVFVVLATSMFGFFEIQLPAGLQTRLSNMSNSQQGGKMMGAFVMGSLSAIIVGPCVAPPLAGVLLYISQTGDQLLGGLALFALGIGMGVPLLVIGGSAGTLLPRAGMWMDIIKKFFGVMLLAVAIWFMSRVISPMIELYLWAVLLIVTAIYMGALDQLEKNASWSRLWKGIGIVMLVYGVVLVIGASSGSESPLKPLNEFAMSSGGGSHEEEELAFRTIKSLDDLNAELEKASLDGKTVMLDFYADWCITCIEMETYTFSEPEVHTALDDVILLQADVTQNDDLDQALMNEFTIFGPPAILFFGSDTKERKARRLVGFLEADKFVDHLAKL
jgi:thiol:disulfide interchange protein DsbD